MSLVRITFLDPARARAPGEALEGDAVWELEEPADALEIRLSWTTDAAVGLEPPVVFKAEALERPPRKGSRHFRYDLPAGPWSFEGRLFSLSWFVEVAVDGRERERAPFVLSPTGAPIRAGEPGPEGRRPD